MLAKVYKHLTFAYFRDTATQETGPKFFTNWNHFSVSLFYFDTFFRLYINKKCKKYIKLKSVKNHQREIEKRTKVINIKRS